MEIFDRWLTDLDTGEIMNLSPMAEVEYESDMSWVDCYGHNDPNNWEVYDLDDPSDWVEFQ